MLTLLHLAACSAPLVLTGVQPAEVRPGATVWIDGEGLTEETVVLVGELPLEDVRLDGEERGSLPFGEISRVELAAGEGCDAVYLRRHDGSRVLFTDGPGLTGRAERLSTELDCPLSREAP